mgnify:CR=1 FL=1
MKATLETVTGVTINRDIDTADSPMGIIRKFYEEDPTAATQIFSNQKAIDQLMDGHIDEAKSAFRTAWHRGRFDSCRLEDRTV